MNTLKNAIEFQYQENIEVRCGQTVTRILHTVDENGLKTVTGVEVNGEELKADAVILATGGFGCSQSQDGLMARFRPDLLGSPTTNGSFAQGDGVAMGEELGAELIDMDKVQLHPTGFIDPKDPSNATKILAPEAIRGCGGVLVNFEGKRFVNELDLRSVVTAGIQKNCRPYRSGDYVGPPFAWCILGQPAQEMFGEKALEFYKDSLGLFEYCEDVEAAAAVIGCSKDVLHKTLEAYEEAMEMGSCQLTFKDVFPTALSAESKGLILARVTPSIHYTMGGLNINAGMYRSWRCTFWKRQ
jgi:succinate dehydrogenase/fumarate reductase flavoprotein subunit